MAAPPSSLSGLSNHARLHRSICKKWRPQPIKPGKTEYLPRAETHTIPKRWEFFTDDYAAWALAREPHLGSTHSRNRSNSRRALWSPRAILRGCFVEHAAPCRLLAWCIGAIDAPLLWARATFRITSLIRNVGASSPSAFLVDAPPHSDYALAASRMRLPTVFS